MTAERGDSLRSLPAIDALAARLEGTAPSRLVVQAAREVVAELRDSVAAGAAPPSHDEVVDLTRTRLHAIQQTLFTRVVNATGVVLHTNLGRAPLGREQLEAVLATAGGYSNLELDLADGKRGSRYAHARTLLRALTGAEDAIVVNNNAAALLLVLAALCRDKDVVISRGELIEIGGEFRIPDVMAESGARLAEVGTTNRTHVADYERAIGPETAAILKVHPSNYRVVGFTASVDARELARLARGRGILMIHDLGSGLFGGGTRSELDRREPLVELALEEGADLVTFSGDKLMGGPQAGIVAGRAALVERSARHPLARAVRVDKMTLAALQATLLMYLEGRANELPLWRALEREPEELRAAAERLVAELAGRVRADVKLEALALVSVAGGGSFPGAELSSWGVAVSAGDVPAAALQTALRHRATPVIARIEADRLVLDLRTVADDELPIVAEALAGSLS